MSLSKENIDPFVALFDSYDFYEFIGNTTFVFTDEYLASLSSPYNFHDFEVRIERAVDSALDYLITLVVQAEAAADSEEYTADTEETICEEVTEFCEDLREAIKRAFESLSGSQERQLRRDLLEQVDDREEEVWEEVSDAFSLLKEVEESVSSHSSSEEATYQEATDEATEPAATAQQEYKEHRRRLLRKRVKKLWVHLTISRDQTASSDFHKEQLLALRSHGEEESNESKERQSQTLISIGGDQRLSSYSNVQGLKPLNKQSSASALLVPSFQQPNPSQKSTKKDISPRIPPHSDFGMPLTSPSAIQENEMGLSEAELAIKAQGNSLDDMDTLRRRIKALEEQLSSSGSTGTKATWQIFHFLEDRTGGGWAAYLDEPTWHIAQTGGASLKASSLIHNVEAYLNNKLDIAFVISKYYTFSKQGVEAEQAIREGNTLPKPEPIQEVVSLCSQRMTAAFKEFVEKRPDYEEVIGKFNERYSIRSPYLFWYQYRSPTALDDLAPGSYETMKLLTSWIDENYGDLYNRVKEQRERNVVSPETMPFLIRPGDVVVWKEKKDLMAVISQSWPRLFYEPNLNAESKLPKWSQHPSTDNSTPSWTWIFDTREIRYDGSFYYEKTNTRSAMKAGTSKTEVPIQELSAYPLRYANDEWKRDLEKRGQTFWSCRKRKLVAYDDEGGFYGSSERFMVDFTTYERLHSDTVTFERQYPMIDDPDCNRMDPQVMESNEPPSAPEIYVFPNNIVGYNLRSKKWVDLEVDKIRDVSWNKKSFDHLVVDHETKELVHALVTNQIARERGTDIIDSKGNGLIILLHGGPGTGKTFTAESVAEIAEKPLFRVTCGDIGTKPEDVEKYLESVLHLGKSWGCVVLLDEAEVFLEQRRLTDLERNALVSVFLRVLEYYEGILILTSNRVGTFDEAFKSRIQLSLHYENLDESQRRRIWKNFLNRLKSLDETIGEGVSNDSIGIDFEDIDCYLPELAKYEMNGRQIRNAITTARQLAQFKEERMMSRHLRHVIKVSAKFDSYLKTVQDGLSDDDAARGYGLR